jgi:hypothetical protein
MEASLTSSVASSLLSSSVRSTYERPPPINPEVLPSRARTQTRAGRTHATSCACAHGLRETRTTVQAASAVASEEASFYPVPPELEHANDVPLLYNSTVPEVSCVSVSRGFRLES